MASDSKRQRQQRSEELGWRLHELERQVEEHSAILRQNPNAMAVAYNEYVAQAPPMGYTPTLEQRETYIADLERILSEDIGNSTFLRLRWVCTAAALIQILMQRAAMDDYAIYLEANKICTALQASHTYAPSHTVIPADPHPTLSREYGLNGQTPSWLESAAQPPPPLDRPEDSYPIVLPASL